MSAARTPAESIVYLLDDEAAVLDALSFLLGSRGLTVRGLSSN